MPKPGRAPFVASAALAAVALLAPVPGSAQDTAGAAQGPVARLADELRSAQAQVDEVERNLAEATSARRTLFEYQRRQRWEEHHDVLMRLARAIEDDTAGPDSATVAFAAEALLRELDTGVAWIDEVHAQALAELDRLAGAGPEELVEDEIELSRLNDGLDRLMIAVTEDYEIAPVLGLDLADRAAAHDSVLVERTELLGATLEFAQDQAGAYRTWLDKPGVDTMAVKLRIAAAEERASGATASLQAMADLIERRGFSAAQYRRLIVTSTGTIGTEVLDTEVLGGILADWTRAIADWLRSNLGAILLKVSLIGLVLVLARRLAVVMRGGVRRAVGHVQLSSLVKNLIVSGASKFVWVVAAIVILAVLGVDLGPMLAGLGIVGFVVGFALQETLANFASGLMIMIYRPFDVGDFVTTGGVTGKVKDLTLVSTVIQTLDNQRIIVPNGKVWGDVINNATAETVRRVDLVFGIGYGDDVDHAREVLEQVLAEHEKVLDEPEPMVRVGELADSSVNLLCRPWCRTEDYWELKWELTRVVKKRFDAEGITIPFPQRDVHLHEVPGTDA